MSYQFAVADFGQVGHANSFVARMAATFLDPNMDHSFAQAHAITKIGGELAQMRPQQVSADDKAPNGTSVTQGSIALG